MLSRLVLLFTVVLALYGCGGGGSGSTGQAQGTTVALQAQIKQGSATIIFSQYTSAASLASLSPTLDYTLKSVINSNAGLMASDVNITSEVITYEYIDSTPTLILPPPTIPALTYNSNLIVTAGGTTDFANVPVFTSTQKSFLKNLNPQLLNNGTDTIRYRVRTTFNGYEVKNGSSISVSTTGTLTVTQ